MKWARIEDGIVREIVDRNPDGRFNCSLVFAQCADEVRCGWRYDGGEFVPNKTDEQVLEPDKMNAVQKEEAYKTFAQSAIAESYSITDEIKLLRRSLAYFAENGANTDEFEEYNDYAEKCIEGSFAKIYART